MAEHDSGEPAPRLPPRVTMPLLTLITQQSLDEDYRHVAERRAAQAARTPTDPEPPRRPRRHLVSALAVALFGVLVAVAAVQTSLNADVDDASRNTLVSRINEERDELAALQERMADLRDAGSDLQRQLNDSVSNEQAAVARLRRLQVRTGFVAVSGPGTVFTVDDPPNADPRFNVRPDNLTWLLDGLWLAGAEAIAINGQRVTAVSGLTQSNTNLNLNGSPLATPYTVRAIGDPDQLQGRLLESGAGALFLDAVNTFGFEYSVQNVDSMVLPAAPARLLRLQWVEAGTPYGPNGPQEDMS